MGTYAMTVIQWILCGVGWFFLVVGFIFHLLDGSSYCSCSKPSKKSYYLVFFLWLLTFTIVNIQCGENIKLKGEIVKIDNDKILREEAIERGYAKYVIVDDEVEFRWADKVIFIYGRSNVCTECEIEE